LMTIPGIGECSAMMLLAEIGDLGRFRDKEALCSYAGLVPRVRESAGKAARGGITRQGSPWMRWWKRRKWRRTVRRRPVVTMNGCCFPRRSTRQTDLSAYFEGGQFGTDASLFELRPASITLLSSVLSESAYCLWCRYKGPKFGLW
jgi:hypothetical protein